MKKSLFLLFVFVFQISGSLTSAHEGVDTNRMENDAPQSVFDRLSQKEVLKITIRTDIDKLLSDKNEDTYQSAYVTFTDADNNQPEWRVQIRPRGKYRKKICDFPPIKVKFDHSVLGPENLKAFKYLKLVTHCSDEAELNELLQKEYLAYKIYNTITDQSLRVQLVKINWIDNSAKHQIGEKWGFIIENEDEMAQRIGGDVYDEVGVIADDLDTRNAAQQALYQYMIGNADWDVPQQKNIVLVKSNSSKDIKIVPFDFDFSGLVNASYAVSQYGLTSIQERIYLGNSDTSELKEAIDIFQAKKKEILELVDSFEHLSRSQRNDVKKYIRSFYNSMDEPLKDIAFYQERITSGKVVSRQ